MEPILIALLAFMLGFGLGGVAGLVFAGRQVAHQLKAEMLAGRLSKADVVRISDLPATRGVSHDNPRPQH